MQATKTRNSRVLPPVLHVLDFEALSETTERDASSYRRNVAAFVDLCRTEIMPDQPKAMIRFLTTLINLLVEEGALHHAMAETKRDIERLTGNSR